MKWMPLLILAAQVWAASTIGWLAAKRIQRYWLEWQRNRRAPGSSPEA